MVDEHIELKVDLSSASRVPNADEAYMLSSAPTMPVYVYSDPSLGVETTWEHHPHLDWNTPGSMPKYRPMPMSSKTSSISLRNWMPMAIPVLM